MVFKCGVWIKTLLALLNFSIAFSINQRLMGTNAKSFIRMVLRRYGQPQSGNVSNGQTDIPNNKRVYEKVYN